MLNFLILTLILHWIHILWLIHLYWWWSKPSWIRHVWCYFTFFRVLMINMTMKIGWTSLMFSCYFSLRRNAYMFDEFVGEPSFWVKGRHLVNIIFSWLYIIFSGRLFFKILLSPWLSLRLNNSPSLWQWLKKR